MQLFNLVYEVRGRRHETDRGGSGNEMVKPSLRGVKERDRVQE